MSLKSHLRNGTACDAYRPPQRPIRAPLNPATEDIFRISDSRSDGKSGPCFWRPTQGCQNRASATAMDRPQKIAPTLKELSTGPPTCSWFRDRPATSPTVSEHRKCGTRTGTSTTRRHNSKHHRKCTSVAAPHHLHGMPRGKRQLDDFIPPASGRRLWRCR